MPVCSYLVVPRAGAGSEVARRMAALPGCDVTRAENRDVLLLVTDTPGPDEDRELRRTLESMEGIQALVLAFGEIDPDTPEADPIRDRDHRKKKRGSRRLPVVDPGGLSMPPAPRPPSPDSDTT